jgi:chromosomal replication initiation ATPase DnaA
MIRQLALPFPHAPDFSRARFLRAPCNEEALAWVGREAEWPMRRLAVWGEAGSGKSHLLHLWAQRHRIPVLAGAQLRLAEAAPDRPVALDDADLAAERPFLHLLNAAAESGLPVLLAARTPPSRWSIALPDLASRLRAILAVRIRPAGDELLRALLAALFVDRQLAVAEPVQEMLLRELPRNPAALREAAARLDRLALAAGGRVTRGLAAEVVAEFTEEEESGLSFDDVSAAEHGSGSLEAPRFL